jgi:hypothetical protein
MASSDGSGSGRRRFLRGVLAALVLGRAAPALAARRSLAVLGQRFAELRARRSRKPDGPGLADYGGELHQVMNELGDRLGVAGTPAARVRKVMGEPDERKPGRWAYQWRGWHDYLYFELADDRVVRADWYMAGE